MLLWPCLEGCCWSPRLQSTFLQWLVFNLEVGLLCVWMALRAEDKLAQYLSISSVHSSVPGSYLYHWSSTFIMVCQIKRTVILFGSDACPRLYNTRRSFCPAQSCTTQHLICLRVQLLFYGWDCFSVTSLYTKFLMILFFKCIDVHFVTIFIYIRVKIYLCI